MDLMETSRVSLPSLLGGGFQAGKLIVDPLPWRVFDAGY